MKRLLVCDSSADIINFSKTDFTTVPLTISTKERLFVDNEGLDTIEMLEYLKKYKGTSHSSCPNPQDYMSAFGDADEVFCITITSSLSGSYNSAMTAKRLFEESGNRRALIIDSLSTGPESALIAEKISDLIMKGKAFEEIESQINEYMKRTRLGFILQSLNNLAKNGRVSPLVAKLCGVLGIRIVGKASSEGTLEIESKARGELNALATLFSNMKKEGYCGGRVKIHHAANAVAAEKLKDKILSEFRGAVVEISPARGLCSFYAELGGLLVGYEI